MVGCGACVCLPAAVGLHLLGSVHAGWYAQWWLHASMPGPATLANAAGVPASAVYADPADTVSTPMDQPVSGNVLSNANVPVGTAASVTGFSVAGSTQVYPPGSNITLTDPLTGQPIGTLVMSSTGAYTFNPVPGYVGPTPAINVYSKDSKGNTAVSSLTIDVGARELHTRAC